MTSTVGLTSVGFVPKQQQTIIAELQAAMRAQFGTGINLGDQSVFGQIISIFAEREALLWQLAEAVYMGQWPYGAEGTGVDNILSLTGLRRLVATATTTNSNPVTGSNGLTLYGLVLGGVAGTVIPKGSIVASTTTPAHNFSTDAAVTISAAANAQQLITLGTAPTTGSYVLSLVDSIGTRLLTPPIAATALPASTLLYWPNGIPPTPNYWAMFDETLVNVIGTPAALVSAILAVAGTGTVTSTSVTNGHRLDFATYAPMIDVDMLHVVTSGLTGAPANFNLTVGGVPTGTVAYSSDGPTMAARLQSAIQATGYGCAVKPLTDGVAVSFLGYSSPIVTINSVVGGALTVAPLNSAKPVVTNSVQGSINALSDPALAPSSRPFADVAVSEAGLTFTVSFGALGNQLGQPTGSTARAIPAMVVLQNTMQASGLFVTAAISVVAPGNPAQIAASATCVETGPIEVVAGQLAVIGTPVSGWTTVTNQLDCLTGRDVETDTGAMLRRADRLAVNSTSPLQGMVAQVRQLPGVTSVRPFENTSQAALQTVTFSNLPAPSSTFQLVFQAGNTTPISAPDVTASSLQAAINAIPAYAKASVSGTMAFGFSIDFAGSMGGQAQPLAQVTNSSSTGITISVDYGRSPGSFELVVDGGLPSQIAQVIFDNKRAGGVAYASPTSRTYGQVTAGSPQLVVASAVNVAPGLSVFGLGVPQGATVVSVSGSTVTMSAPALGTYTDAPLTFNASVQVVDSEGNPTIIGFTRPQSLLVYVKVALITDQYRVPGNAASGINGLARWNSGRLADVQQAVVDVGSQIGVGGLVIGIGSDGLVGAFNRVPGIVDFDLSFALSPSPTNVNPIQMLPTQRPLFQVGAVTVTYT